MTSISVSEFVKPSQSGEMSRITSSVKSINHPDPATISEQVTTRSHRTRSSDGREEPSLLDDNLEDNNFSDEDSLEDDEFNTEEDIDEHMNLLQNSVHQVRRLTE